MPDEGGDGLFRHGVFKGHLAEELFIVSPVAEEGIKRAPVRIFAACDDGVAKDHSRRLVVAIWHIDCLINKVLMPHCAEHCGKMPAGRKADGGYLFRVFYHGNRISADVFHAISDGYGNTVFVSTLVAEYLRLKGYDIPAGGMVLDTGAQPTEDEMLDAYTRFASSKASYNRRDKAVYHAVGTKTGRHMCNYTVGIMSFEQVHAVSKGYGVTVTEFFAAILMDILYRKQLGERKKQREVSVQIPVNLRKFFPTNTLRNFVLCLRVKMNPNMGEYTFEEILKLVSLQLRLVNDEKTVNSMMTQNLKIEQNPFAKFFPLFVKNLSVALTFLLTGEQTTSALLSNIGAVNIPDEMKEHIEKYFFFTGPGKLNGARCGVITLGDKLAFTFSNCYDETDIEREFFTRLVKMGVHVKIESNRS